MDAKARTQPLLRDHHHLMMNFTRHFIQCLGTPIFRYLTTLSLSLILFFSVLVFYSESENNIKLSSYFDCLYYSVTVMTGVGLGDLSAITPAGKIVSMLMMLLGTAIYVSFTAVLATLLLEFPQSKNKLDENRF